MRPEMKAPAAAEAAPEPVEVVAQERSIGDIIRDTRNLKASQVERILAYQREHGVRFGEAAVALKMASADDVVYALAQQFHYPFASESQRGRCPELVVLNQPFSEQAEAFRAIRSQITMRMFSNPDGRRVLAVISPELKDGKSFFAANIAASLAQLGGRTLLIDADLRLPRQHEIFRLEDRAGLSAILSGRSRSRVIQEVQGLPGLFVLPVGIVPPNPLELIERSTFGLVISELASKFDHVVVDTSAASFGSDAFVIAARCTATLMLARRHQTRVDALREMAAALESTPTQLAGVIINDH